MIGIFRVEIKHPFLPPGPVIGGFLASMVSMHTTFGLMGGLYATMALYCSRFVPETLQRPRRTAADKDAAGKAGAVVSKGPSWSSLLRSPPRPHHKKFVLHPPQHSAQ